MKILVYRTERKVKDCRNKGILSEYSEAVLFSRMREKKKSEVLGHGACSKGFCTERRK